jgi:hypothetical protein
MQNGIDIWELVVAARAHEARYDEVHMAELAEVADRCALDLRVGEEDIDELDLLVGTRFGRYALLLLIDTDAEEPTHAEQRENDTHYAQRIGHSIARGDVGVMLASEVEESLLGRT